jgi:hypothetical protein
MTTMNPQPFASSCGSCDLNGAPAEAHAKCPSSIRFAALKNRFHPDKYPKLSALETRVRGTPPISMYLNWRERDKFISHLAMNVNGLDPETNSLMSRRQVFFMSWSLSADNRDLALGHRRARRGATAAYEQIKAGALRNG